MGFNLGNILKSVLPVAASFIPGIGPIASSVLGGVMGGMEGADKPSGQQAPTGGTTPWAPQANALQDLYGRGKTWMDQYGGMSGAEQTGQRNIMDFYGQGGQGQQLGQEFMGRGRGLADQGYGAATNFLGQNAPQAGIDMGVMGQAANNPYAEQSIDAMAGDVTRNMQRNILPSIRNRAGQQGLIGSSRAGLSEGLAASDASRQIGDLAQKYRSDMYNTALGMGGQFGMANAAAQQARQLQQAQLGANLGGAGMGQMGEGYGMSGDALSKYMAGAGMGRDITGGAMDKYKGWLSGGPTTTSFEGQVTAPSKDQNILGGIVSGIGTGLKNYQTDRAAEEENLMKKYQFGQQNPGYADWRSTQDVYKPSGIFGY